MDLQTEIYVSLNGEDFYKLDLTQNESIEMKYILKDTTNLSKIFSPYSLSFTFPGTLNNQRRLGFIGNVKVLKTNTSNTLACKIYSNGTLFQTGKLAITEVREEMGKIKTFTGNFTSTMIDLATRMGGDVLSDLPDEPITISWLPNDVYDSIKTVQVHPTGVKFYTPLISNTRIFQRQLDTSINYLDNVAYFNTSSPTSNKTLKSTEFRPAVQGKAIIDLIKSKYDLEIEMPLEQTAHYNDWYIWCNAEKLKKSIGGGVVVNSNFQNISITEQDPPGGDGLPPNRRYDMTVNTSTNVFTVVRDDSFYPSRWLNHFGFITNISNVINLDGATTKEFLIVIKRVSDGKILNSETFAADSNNNVSANLPILDTDFLSATLDFIVEVYPQQPCSWSNMKFTIVQVYFYEYKFITNVAEYKRWEDASVINNNSVAMGSSNIDLFDIIPETKVTDFLNSFFKLFNISIFDASPTDDKLYWLTPQDLLVTNKLYSKKVLDYTPYVVSENVDKKIAAEFNYYNFKHKTSKYKSNLDYQKGYGIEFGQLVYPAIKPLSDLNEFKVETAFSIFPAVPIAGMFDEFTSYGFTDAAPEILVTNEKRYKPNWGELTMFFNAGIRDISGDKRLAFQKINGGTNLITAALSSYVKTSPVHPNGFSFGFGLIQEATERSLYNDFYKTQTERLLDPNSLQHSFSLELPSSELVLNFNTTIQGQSQIPNGFRLQNEIVIQENRYSIVDANIDATTGKTKLNLLNF